MWYLTNVPTFIARLMFRQATTDRPNRPMKDIQQPLISIVSKCTVSHPYQRIVIRRLPWHRMRPKARQPASTNKQSRPTHVINVGGDRRVMEPDAPTCEHAVHVCVSECVPYVCFSLIKFHIIRPPPHASSGVYSVCDVHLTCLCDECEYAHKRDVRLS